MSAAEEEPIDEGVRSFTRILDQINHGHASIELSEEMHTTVGLLRAQAERHDAIVKGKMTIKIDLEVLPHGEVRLAVQSSSSISKPKAHGSTAWLTPGGNVTFEHPQQQKLPLTEVINKSTGEITDINNGIAETRSDK